ncbi:Spo0E family sporulation regulatory protein-aspartic acid phosphatase [Paenibacillus sp. 1P03SA]|uniref:Spo0E family sporulation regulatory protein-aspartic acid phosphatase n=1 Tax=Paenibacillus sp. 1P03SA TaxID=3132294 RepID=UPI0039A39086
MKNLLEQIEIERAKLNALASLYGPAAPQVIAQSQKLDGLLNTYTKERVNA